MTLSDKEWAKRVLCSDGNCIGVVGADGRCKLCGLRYKGDLSAFEDGNGQGDGVKEETSQPPPMAEDVTESADETSLGEESVEDAWEKRTLCADQSCIGVIGPDGTCKECGKPYPQKGDG